MNKHSYLTTAYYWIASFALATIAYFIIGSPRVFWGGLVLIYSVFVIHELINDTEEADE
jgi:membrane protein YdbS with pleckstrin-like domain